MISLVSKGLQQHIVRQVLATRKTYRLNVFAVITNFRLRLLPSRMANANWSDGLQRSQMFDRIKGEGGISSIWKKFSLVETQSDLAKEHNSTERRMSPSTIQVRE
jgi:hypothetical protein